jgi:hypothetical protein
MFDELVSEMVKGNTLLCEFENLKQTHKKLTRLSAFAFFSIVVRMKNSQLLFLMVNFFFKPKKQSWLFEKILAEMDGNVELKPVYPE